MIQWGSPLGAPQPPAGLAEIVGVACGSQFSLALRRNGTVIGWGQTSIPAGLENVTAVAAAAVNSLALKADGTVVGWGSDSLLRQVPPDLDGVVAIAISETHALALRSDGKVIRWGRNINSGQDQSLPQFKDVTAIAAGPTESFGIRAPLRFTQFEVIDLEAMGRQWGQICFIDNCFSGAPSKAVIFVPPARLDQNLRMPLCGSVGQLGHHRRQ